MSEETIYLYMVQNDKTHDYGFREYKSGMPAPEEFHIIKTWPLRDDRYNNSAAARAMEVYYEVDTQLREDHFRKYRQHVQDMHILWRHEQQFIERIEVAIEPFVIGSN